MLQSHKCLSRKLAAKNVLTFAKAHFIRYADPTRDMPRYATCKERLKLFQTKLPLEATFGATEYRSS